jgi:hypothetical protein
MNLMEQQDQWADWNRWADSRIAKYLDEHQPFSETQNEILVEVIAELRGEWQQDIEQKLGELRAEIEVLRGVIKSQNVGVTRSKRDVA